MAQSVSQSVHHCNIDLNCLCTPPVRLVPSTPLPTYLPTYLTVHHHHHSLPRWNCRRRHRHAIDCTQAFTMRVAYEPTTFNVSPPCRRLLSLNLMETTHKPLTFLPNPPLSNEWKNLIAYSPHYADYKRLTKDNILRTVLLKLCSA